LRDVDWLEAQGNYIALHVGGNTHLVRETLGTLEGQLDPRAFVRIHRRIIVAIERVRAVTPLPGGDATLLVGEEKAELRVSRSFRAKLRAAVAAKI
jgi:two-component system LytT family response regulator